MSILKKFLGTKSDKDIRSILPTVDKANSFFEEYKSLSNDELRAKTSDFKQLIAEHVSDEESMISDLKKEIEAQEDILERERCGRMLTNWKKTGISRLKIF